VDRGVFEKISGGDFGIEGLAAEEKVIVSIDFARTGGSGGAGGGIVCFLVIGEATAERGFS
jgi:hypothetical protein